MELPQQMLVTNANFICNLTNPGAIFLRGNQSKRVTHRPFLAVAPAFVQAATFPVSRAGRHHFSPHPLFPQIANFWAEYALKLNNLIREFTHRNAEKRPGAARPQTGTGEVHFSLSHQSQLARFVRPTPNSHEKSGPLCRCCHDEASGDRPG